MGKTRSVARTERAAFHWEMQPCAALKNAPGAGLRQGHLVDCQDMASSWRLTTACPGDPSFSEHLLLSVHRCSFFWVLVKLSPKLVGPKLVFDRLIQHVAESSNTTTFHRSRRRLPVTLDLAGRPSPSLFWPYSAARSSWRRWSLQGLEGWP